MHKMKWDFVVQAIADDAAKRSGTSYETYILLFSSDVDKRFSHFRHKKHIIELAQPYGYATKRERELLVEL
ncbi:hypothetical protein [Photobacterium indicum]|uniref:hypothetical protein n=1 Tax=Photobacterium indicum TaxID=81447 RepID=UPI003D10E36C